MEKSDRQNVFFRKTIWLLLSLFVISVLIRIPNLNRPLSKHHEFCTALSLIILQSWEDNGIHSVQSNPSTTYALLTDQFINNCSMDTMQRNGKFFYLSHPPLAYYLPYAIFTVLNIYPDVLPLQIFNLFFEFSTIVFIYLITSLLLQNDYRKSLSTTAFIAAGIYLFLPITLWFHSNVYMADMFVQNMWAPALFIALKIFIGKKEASVGWLLAYCLSLLVMIYTDWLGVWFAITATVASLYLARKRSTKSFLFLALFTVIITFLAVGSILYQYASIAGWDILMYCFQNRYQERGSLNWNNLSIFFSSLKEVGFNYAMSYLPVLFVILFFLFQRKLIVSQFPGFKIFAFLSLTPVLLDHLIFFRYAGQDFALLKDAIFLSITAAMTISSQMKTQDNRKKIILSSIAISLAGIMIYFFINRPGEYSLNGDRYADEKKVGRFIYQNADPTEVVFATGIEVSPQIIFYAHRNIKKVESQLEAVKFLQLHSSTKGILFQMDETSSLSFEKFNVP